MNLLRDVVRELFSMFLADAKLSGAVLALVAGAAVLIDVEGLNPMTVGFGLLLGCLATLAAVTAVEAKQRH